MATTCGIPHPTKKVLPSSSSRAPWAIMNSVSVNSIVRDIPSLLSSATRSGVHVGTRGPWRPPRGGRPPPRAPPPRRAAAPRAPRARSPERAPPPGLRSPHGGHTYIELHVEECPPLKYPRPRPSPVPFHDRGRPAKLRHPAGADPLCEEILPIVPG